MIQTAKTMTGGLPGGAGVPDVAQVEVRLAKDVPLGERVAQIREHLQKTIQEAGWAGKMVQPDASVFVGIFIFMEELVKRVEALEGKDGEGEIVEP